MKKTVRPLDVNFVNIEINDIRTLFKNECTFHEGLERFLSLHSYFYKSEMSGINDSTFEDAL